MNKENTCCNKCKDYDPCYKISCPCHKENMPDAKEMFKKALEKMDFEGMARVWHEGNIQWHAKEWKDFIAQERAKAVSEVSDYIMSKASTINDTSTLRRFIEAARSRGESNEKEV